MSHFWTQVNSYTQEVTGVLTPKDSLLWFFGITDHISIPQNPNTYFTMDPHMLPGYQTQPATFLAAASNPEAIRLSKRSTEVIYA